MAAGPAEGDVFRSQWLAFPVEVFLVDDSPGGPPVAIEVRAGDEVGTIEARDGEVMTRVGGCEHPDLVLDGPPHPILGLLSGQIDAAAARAAGVVLEGDEATLSGLRGSAAAAATHR